MAIGLGLGIPARHHAGIWLPTSIANCELWLRGDLGVTLNGGNVATWADQSGNGRDATQSTAAYQPLFESTGFGGQPSVQGDGTNDHLIADSVGTVVAGNAKPFTIVSAMQQVTVIDNTRFYGFGKSGSALPYHEHFFKTTTNERSITSQDDGGTAGNAAASSAAGTDQHVVSDIYDGDNDKFYQYVDGSVAINGAAFAVGQRSFDKFALFALRRGGSAFNHSNSRLAEILLYSRALSTAERQQIETYMKARYGTP